MSDYPNLPGRVVALSDTHVGIIARDIKEGKYYCGAVPRELLQPCHKSDLILPQLNYVLEWGNTIPDALGDAAFAPDFATRFGSSLSSEKDKEACWVAYFGHHARYNHYVGMACAILKDGRKVATTSIIPVTASSDESLSLVTGSNLNLSAKVASVMCDLKLGVSV